MHIFAVEDQHQKARQEAIVKLEPGQKLRMTMDEPLWDRPVAVHFRSPRGPKGASLGYAPIDIGRKIAQSQSGLDALQAIVLKIQQHNEMLQLIVAVTHLSDTIGTITAQPDFEGLLATALAEAPKQPVYVPRLYPVGVVGESNYQPAIRRTRVGQPVSFKHEPSNKYDRRAIMVTSSNGELIGYLPRESWLHRVMLDEGQQVSARIKAIDGSPRGVVLDLVLGTPEELTLAVAHEPADYMATIHVDVQDSSSKDTMEKLGRAAAHIPPAIWGILVFGLILLLGFCGGAIR